MPRQSARITLVNDVNFLLYTPFLPEAAAGMLEPRHVVTPLRDVLKQTHLRLGVVVGRDPARAHGHAARPRGAGTRAALRPPGGGARLRVPGAADTRPGGACDRLQEPRRRDLASKPRDPVHGGGGHVRRPRDPGGVADLRVRGRRLCRSRGARGAAGLRRRGDRGIPTCAAAGDALDPRRGDGPGAARDRREAGGVRAPAAARARHRHPPRDHARGGHRHLGADLHRRDLRHPDRRVDGRRRAPSQQPPPRPAARRAGSHPGGRPPARPR